PVDEIAIRTAFDEHARTAQTDLTLIRERRPHAARNRSIEIGVGEDDVWILPSELERNFFEKWRARLRHFAASHGSPSERDRVDLRMRGDSRADIWSGSVHDVEHAIRQSGCATNLAEQ